MNILSLVNRLGCALILATPLYTNAAMLDVQGGRLHGASGITYDNFIYSVEFKDGSLGGLFPGGIPDYTNTTPKALGLMQALYDQVIDNRVFDDAPQGIVGCSADRNFCSIFSPPIRDTGIGQARVGLITNYNFASGITDTITESGFLFASTTSSTQTFAVFTQVEAVPEPEAFAMFLAGLGLLGCIFRNKKSLRNKVRIG